MGNLWKLRKWKCLHSAFKDEQLCHLLWYIYISVIIDTLSAVVGPPIILSFLASFAASINFCLTYDLVEKNFGCQLVPICQYIRFLPLRQAVHLVLFDYLFNSYCLLRVLLCWFYWTFHNWLFLTVSALEKQQVSYS